MSVTIPKSNIERLADCEKELAAHRDELAYCRRVLELQTPLVEMALTWIKDDQERAIASAKRVGA